LTILNEIKFNFAHILNKKTLVFLALRRLSTFLLICSTCFNYNVNCQMFRRFRWK